MTLYKNRYRIESARLQGYDYSSPGYYFLTVCTHKRINVFGEIIGNKINLNEYGRIVVDEWNKSFDIRRELLPDEFIVMPNHFHGIVRIVETPGRGNARTIVETPDRRNARPGVSTTPCGSMNTDDSLYTGRVAPKLTPKSVSSFMAGVKSAITKRINEMRGTPGERLLQYRFHDHIIQNAQELFRIREYIKNNPKNWVRDKLRNKQGETI